jgi:hypothetical protein
VGIVRGVILAMVTFGVVGAAFWCIAGEIPEAGATAGIQIGLLMASMPNVQPG